MADDPLDVASPLIPLGITSPYIPLDILALADPHWGSIYAMYPEKYQYVPHGYPNGPKIEAAQGEAYNAFAEMTRKKPDILLLLGDLIDGRGERAGGLEIAYPDRKKQVEIAVEILSGIGAKEIYMVRGTPYHTGMEEDWEDLIAQGLKADAIDDVLHVDIRGVVFCMRHYFGNTSTPYFGGNALGREIAWQRDRAAAGEEPRADVLLYGHIHRQKVYMEDGALAMTLPGLALKGGKFPRRKLSSRVHFGATRFSITDRQSWLEMPTWRSDIRPVRAECLKAIVAGGKATMQ